jgi:hypothetical protein
MKKILIIALVALAFGSCKKDRSDVIKKDEYKTYYFRVDGVEDASTISTNIVTVSVKQN